MSKENTKAVTVSKAVVSKIDKDWEGRPASFDTVQRGVKIVVRLDWTIDSLRKDVMDFIHKTVLVNWDDVAAGNTNDVSASDSRLGVSVSLEKKG